MRSLWCCLFLVFGFSVHGQEIFGTWKTIDDESGEAKSLVEIYKQDGKAYGKVVKLFRKPTEIQDPLCNLCEDDRKGQRVMGMEVIRGLEKDGNEWEDGTILDPQNGKEYDCKIWLDEENPDKLIVRGYILFFYRTQTWLRQ
ncbi:MAG: DUF2147 domain-containing protein [Luteibaculum sp.]